MLKILADGEEHSLEDLHPSLEDELSELNTVHTHISNLRHKLRPLGEDIICLRKPKGKTRKYVITFRHVKWFPINKVPNP
jgi:hypothetical protein